MSSLITEYRADFYLGNQDLSFSVDGAPEKDVDVAIPPLRIHGGHIQDSGAEYFRWCRGELEQFIGDQVTTPYDAATDAFCIFTLSDEGDILLDASTAAVTRIEAFGVNRIGGVKRGIFATVVGNPQHSVLSLPATDNYVLERLCYRLASSVTLFDSVSKHRGKRKRLNP